LHTLESMREAQELYKKLGSLEEKDYYDAPVEGAVFLELDLS
jgi:hypothetical protein